MSKATTISTSTNIRIGIILSYVALAVSVIGNLFVTPIVLNFVGDDQYGLYTFAISITSYLTIVSSALSASFVRFAAREFRENGNTNKTNSLFFKLLLLIGSSVFVLFSLLILAAYFAGFRLPQYSPEENGTIYFLLFVSSINVFVQIGFCVFTLFCTFKQRFVFVRSLNLFVTILTLACNAAIAIGTENVKVICLGILSIQVLSTILTIIYAIKFCGFTYNRFRFRDNKALIKEVAIFSSFILFNSIVDTINSNADKTILGLFVNAESVTIYQLAHSFSTYLLTASTAVCSNFIPKAHNLYNQNKIDELNELFLKVCKLQTIICLLFVAGFYACGYEFILLWLGSQRIDVFYYALVLVSLSIVPMTVNLGIEIQRAANKHKFRAISYLLICVVNVALSIILVLLLPSEYKIWGTILGTVVANVSGIWIILNIYNARVMKLPMLQYVKSLLSIAALALIAVFAAYLASYFVHLYFSSTIVHFLVKGFVFTAIYSLLVFLCNRTFIYSIFHKNANSRKTDFKIFTFKRIQIRKKPLLAGLGSFLVCALVFIVGCVCSCQTFDYKLDSLALRLGDYTKHTNLDYVSSRIEVFADGSSDFYEASISTYNQVSESTQYKEAVLATEKLAVSYGENLISDSIRLAALQDYSSYKTQSGDYRLNKYNLYTVFSPIDIVNEDCSGFAWITDTQADQLISLGLVDDYQDLRYSDITVSLPFSGDVKLTVTNIIETSKGSFDEISEGVGYCLISNFLNDFENSRLVNYSLTIVLYNNPFSNKLALEMVGDAFDVKTIRMDFITYDYSSGAFVNNFNFAQDFRNLMSIKNYLQVNYWLYIVPCVGAVAICLLFIFKNGIFNLTFLVLSGITIIAVGVLATKIYVYYVFGGFFLVFMLTPFVIQILRIVSNFFRNRKGIGYGTSIFRKKISL